MGSFYLRSIADHRQQHLERGERLDGVRFIGGENDDFALAHAKRPAGDGYVGLALDQADRGVKWRGMLAQTLAFIKGK